MLSTCTAGAPAKLFSISPGSASASSSPAASVDRSRPSATARAAVWRASARNADAIRQVQSGSAPAVKLSQDLVEKLKELARRQQQELERQRQKEAEEAELAVLEPLDLVAQAGGLFEFQVLGGLAHI